MSQRALKRLQQQLADAVLETQARYGDETAVIVPARWQEVARFLRDDPQTAMDHFVDLTCVDYPDDPDSEEPPKGWRFEVVLSLRSLRWVHRIRIKARLPGDEPEIDSLTPVFLGANWFEREAYDMFGVRFVGHPDLRRILMYEEFVGYPLRKDYPVQLTQPLVPYREVPGTEKLSPFGAEMGMPFGRRDWVRTLTAESHPDPQPAADETEAPEPTEETS